MIFYRLLGRARQVEESGHFNKFAGARLGEVKSQQRCGQEVVLAHKKLQSGRPVGARRLRNQRISLQDGATRTACGG